MSEETIQRNYYAATADRYDQMHLADHDEHHTALRYAMAFFDQEGIRSMLDVGCGTGRAIAYLHSRNPDITAFGIEPVKDLLKVAAQKRGCAQQLVNGSGIALPFRSGSFDAVVECGVLHHVREPQRLVEEMTRVARKAVFLSDSNMFGHGRPLMRHFKLCLYRAGLWRIVKFVQTRGKGYTISEGDGLAYSYSVYFQYAYLSRWSN